MNNQEIIVTANLHTDTGSLLYEVDDWANALAFTDLVPSFNSLPFQIKSAITTAVFDHIVQVIKGNSPEEDCNLIRDEFNRLCKK